MGVTIHFEGRLNSESAFDRVMDLSLDFATRNGMAFEKFALPLKRLERVLNEQEWNYEGPVKGIKIIPSHNCEPLWLEFDENLFVQDFCKTQFAGVEVHIEIVELLEELSQYFESLLITDEGEYWDTRDVNRLQEAINECYELMENAKRNDKTLSGPFRLEDGRIADMMH